MNKKTPKKTAQASNLHSTNRTALLKLILGVMLSVVGLAFVLSQTWHGGSTVLFEMSKALYGLGGQLGLLIPILLIYSAVRLLISLGHKTAGRDVWLLSGMYVCLLTFITLITMITGRGSLMDYMGQINEQSAIVHPQSYGAYLRRAYALGSQCGGGLLGMLLSYPLWRLLGQVGAAVVMAAAMIVLILVLLRLNPAEMINNTSDKMAERRQKKALKRQERQENQEYEAVLQETAQNIPVQVQERRTVPQRGYTPAPAYTVVNNACGYAQPQINRTQQNQPEGFYTVSNNQIYDEPFESVKEPVLANQPEENEEMMPPAEENREYEEKEYEEYEEKEYTDPSEPQEEMPWHEEVVPVREMEEESVYERWEDYQEESKALTPEQTEMQDTKEERTSFAAEKKQPVFVREEKNGYAPENQMEKREEHSAFREEPPQVRKDPAASSANSWMQQLNERRRQADMAPADEQLTDQVTQGHARPVFTENAVELTGERIPIRGGASSHAVKEKPKSVIRMDHMASDAEVKTIGAPVLIDYQAPPIQFLKEGLDLSAQDHSQEDNDRAERIEATLKSFNIQAQVKQVMHGPAITRFAIQIAPGIRVGRVTSMADNLALNLATKHVRMEAPIQGTNYIGIEVPNAKTTPVMLREVLESPAMKANHSPLAVALGKDIAGSPVICDLSKMPHLLIAGSTGSGKSVCIQGIVCSILYRTSPAQVRLIMVDPKQVELNMYNGIPHLLIPVVTDMRKAAGALSWAVQEMRERYAKIAAVGEHDLAGYNSHQTEEEKLPNIVIIIDEMANLMDMCRKEVEDSIRQLAALARAAGIYMVLATQRPSVDVITGVIKNNIPSRIAFAVSSGTDSRTILDMYGAEKLMGKGDMLYKPSGMPSVRVQGSFISAAESNQVADYIRDHYQTNYDPNVIEHLTQSEKETREADDASDDGGEEQDEKLDDLLHEAIQMAIEDGQISTSMLQRRLRIGYARAGRLVDEMEKRGIVSAQDGSKPRKTMITRDEYYDMFADED